MIAFFSFLSLFTTWLGEDVLCDSSRRYMWSLLDIYDASGLARSRDFLCGEILEVFSGTAITFCARETVLNIQKQTVIPERISLLPCLIPFSHLQIFIDFLQSWGELTAALLPVRTWSSWNPV